MFDRLSHEQRQSINKRLPFFLVLVGQKARHQLPLYLTSPQIETFAPKIAAKIGSWHARMGESASDYLNRVKSELGNSEKVEFYRQYLTELGFKN